MIIYNYVFIGMLLLGAIGFALAPIIVMNILAPRKRSKSKSETYECGLLTTGETWVKFRIQYYIYAIMFLVFDIETVFLYPWAAAYESLGAANSIGLFALIEMVVFLLILPVGLVYAWAKGVLKWD